MFGEKTLYPAMKLANFVKDCFPEPPTPTSRAHPPAFRKILDIFERIKDIVYPTSLAYHKANPKT